MELSEIKAFLTLAEELHFGRAADRLNLSQPQVSRIIRAVEMQVGGALFHRTSRKVQLTRLGVELHGRVSGPYADLSKGIIEVRAFARASASVLRIGGTTTSGSVTLTRLVTAFERQLRMCHTILREVDPLNPYAALRNAEVDVLIDWLVVNEPDLVVGPVIEQRPRVLAVARFHPLATKRCVSIEDIADYEVAQFPSPPYPAALLDALVPPITPSGIPVRRTHVIRAASETISLVALGRIVHPTAASVAIFQRDDIVFVPIADMPPLPLGLIWHKSHQDRRVRTFARFVEKFTAQTASGSAT